jgi:hypothetical protein
MFDWQYLRNEKGALTFAAQFTIFLFIVTLIAGGACVFSNEGRVYDSGVAVIKNLVISKPVEREESGGKSRSIAYIFTFKGYQARFDFGDRYFPYSQPAFSKNDYAVGDTLSIQVFPRYLDEAQDASYSGSITVVNLAKGNGKFIINHVYRNAMINKENKIYFIIAAILFVGMLLVTLGWVKYKTALASKISSGAEKLQGISN